VWVVLVFLLAIAAAGAAFLVLRDDQSNTRNPDASTPSTVQSLDSPDRADREPQFA
jgi:hypothetical protein